MRRVAIFLWSCVHIAKTEASKSTFFVSDPFLTQNHRKNQTSTRFLEKSISLEPRLDICDWICAFRACREYCIAWKSEKMTCMNGHWSARAVGGIYTINTGEIIQGIICLSNCKLSGNGYNPVTRFWVNARVDHFGMVYGPKLEENRRIADVTYPMLSPYPSC